MGYEHKNTEEGVGWGVVLFLFDQLVVNGKEHEFQAVGDSQLVKDVRQVVFSSVFTDPELSSQILIGVSRNDEGDDLQLTGGKPKVSWCL